MVNWKKLASKINSRVQITKNIFYEVVWTDEFKTDLYGEMRPDFRQIVIKKELSKKDSVITYLHEIAHAASNEYEMNLTENQILKMEKFLYFLLKKGNVFKDE